MTTDHEILTHSKESNTGYTNKTIIEEERMRERERSQRLWVKDRYEQVERDGDSRGTERDGDSKGAGRVIDTKIRSRPTMKRDLRLSITYNEFMVTHQTEIKPGITSEQVVGKCKRRLVKQARDTQYVSIAV